MPKRALCEAVHKGWEVIKEPFAHFLQDIINVADPLFKNKLPTVVLKLLQDSTCSIVQATALQH